MVPTPEPTAPDEMLSRMRQRCQEHGLTLTAAREAILATLAALGTHPTADEVHGAVARAEPGIGRATVYRALESFVRAGVLTKAPHQGAAIRYDANVDRHHHLVCLRCDRILDIQDPRLDDLPVPDTSQVGFAVEDVQVHVRGICRQCQQVEKEHHA